jgi:hypothetical protein
MPPTEFARYGNLKGVRHAVGFGGSRLHDQSDECLPSGSVPTATTSPERPTHLKAANASTGPQFSTARLIQAEVTHRPLMLDFNRVLLARSPFRPFLGSRLMEAEDVGLELFSCWPQLPELLDGVFDATLGVVVFAGFSRLNRL